jgi:hypothetical protein
MSPPILLAKSGKRAHGEQGPGRHQVSEAIVSKGMVLRQVVPEKSRKFPLLISSENSLNSLNSYFVKITVETMQNYNV